MTNTRAQAVIANYLMFHTVTDAELDAFVMAATALDDDWIPVEKGLPKDGEYVLAYRPRITLGEPINTEHFYSDIGWDFDECFNKHPVTHWRHLPDAPEKEEEHETEEQ